MKYLCLVYRDEKEGDALPRNEDDALVDVLPDERDHPRASGRFIVADGLQPVGCATTIRVRNGTLSITDGPRTETREQLGGFSLIEARDLNDALRMAAKMPPAGLGCVEVRPVDEFDPA